MPLESYLNTVRYNATENSPIKGNALRIKSYSRESNDLSQIHTENVIIHYTFSDTLSKSLIITIENGIRHINAQSTVEDHLFREKARRSIFGQTGF